MYVYAGVGAAVGAVDVFAAVGSVGVGADVGVDVGSDEGRGCSFPLPLLAFSSDAGTSALFLSCFASAAAASPDSLSSFASAAAASTFFVIFDTLVGSGVGIIASK
jgi:hypothetical protein